MKHLRTGVANVENIAMWVSRLLELLKRCQACEPIQELIDELATELRYSRGQDTN